MAERMTTIAFDETEREILREVANANRINNAVKPSIAALKDLANSVRELTAREMVDTNEISAAQQSSERLAASVRNLPDSDAKQELLDSIDAAQNIINQALSL